MNLSRLVLRIVLFAGLFASPASATLDRDSDGVSDLWPALHPTAGAPEADPDGDGATNRAEAIAGTDPTSASSHLAATPERDATGNLVLHWPSALGKHYKIESSADLGAWEPFATPRPGTGADLSEIVRPASAPASPRQFWRVAVSDADSDSDALNDWEESLYGTSPTISDSDLDGETDGREATAGTAPTVANFTETAPDTVFQLTTATVDVGGIAATHYYHFKAPAAYNADKTVAYPLVVYLHPYGHSNLPADLHDGSPYAPGEIQALTQSTQYPAFVYVPVCPPPYPDSGQWNTAEAAAMVVTTIRDLCTRFHIDPRRIYLAGFSMGGSGSYYIGHAYHQATASRFAAVSRSAGMSPSLAQFPAIHASLALSPVWIHVGEDDGDITTLAIEAYDYLKTVRLVQGGTEATEVRSAGVGFVATPDPADLVADHSAVTLAGNRIARLSVYRDRGHEGGLMFQNADLFPWLFAQSLPDSALPLIPPTITSPPASITVPEGQTATFNVAATGTPTPLYQWFKDGSPISSARSSSYTTPPSTGADHGAVFSVVVTNPEGSVLSLDARLTVTPSGTYAFPAPLARLTTRADVLSLVTGTTYWLDATNGNDTTGTGTTALPWRTLAKVHAVLQSGDCVVLRTGNYGTFSQKTVRSVPTVYLADLGHNPVLTNIRLRDNDAPNHTVGDPETAYRTNLVFHGIGIAPAYVDPGPTDPMVPDATASTYAKCTYAIDLKWFGGITFLGCRMSPSDSYGANKKFLSVAAVSLVNAPDVWIEGNDLDSFNSGIDFTGAPRLRIYHNQIHGIAAGMVSGKDALSLDAVIEGNHLHGSSWAVTDPYCPRRSVADHYHGSFMSVRGSNTVVRNNIMHNGCNSSGMMLYDDAHLPFDNVLIEGNQIYDSNNAYALRLYNVNRNVVVRNNTLISKGRYGTTGEFKYNTALAVHSFLGAATGKRLLIHNNVIVGRIALPPTLDEVDLAGNIVYSSSAPLPAGNTVAYPDAAYFEAGFFAGELDVSWQNWENDGAGFANPQGHGKLLDLRLAAGSPALGHGLASLQSPSRIGGLTANGFLMLSLPRSVTAHSAGAME